MISLSRRAIPRHGGGVRVKFDPDKPEDAVVVPSEGSLWDEELIDAALLMIQESYPGAKAVAGSST